MITDIWFDDVIVVKQGKDHGSLRSELRDTNFHAPDWEIRETLPGVFSLWTEGMDVPQMVGGYGYSYRSVVPAESEPEPHPIATQSKKGKR